MRSTIALVAALALLVGAGACLDGGSAAAQHAEDEPAAPASSRPGADESSVSSTARALLRPRMYRHGDDMESLLWAVLTLDFRAAEIISARMSGEPRIKPATDGPLEPLSRLVPDDFLEREQQLFDGASRVLRAARLQKPVQTAVAYGDLVRTCVGCHARYRHAGPTH